MNFAASIATFVSAEVSSTPAWLLSSPLPQTVAPDAPPSEPTGGVPLSEAISKQLGLKLEMQKRMLPVVVIDHIDEKPLAN